VYLHKGHGMKKISTVVLLGCLVSQAQSADRQLDAQEGLFAEAMVYDGKHALPVIGVADEGQVPVIFQGDAHFPDTSGDIELARQLHRQEVRALLASGSIASRSNENLETEIEYEPISTRSCIKLAVGTMCMIAMPFAIIFFKARKAQDSLAG
jgi:hypothetical protein